MNTTRLSLRRSGLALLTLAALAAGAPAHAQVVAGGTDTGSIYPFGGDNSAASGNDITYQGEYQQIYDSTIFTSPTLISGLAFSSAAPFSDSDPAGSNVAETVNYDFTIKLSNTSASATSASTNFASNLGGNLSTVFTGTVQATLTAQGDYDLLIPFQNSFLYTPAASGAGNLLLDVTLVSANAGPSGQTDIFQSGTADNTSTVAFSDGHTNPVFSADQGLLTSFTATSAPEPSPVAVFAVIAAGIVGLAVRKRHAGRS